MSDSKPYLTEDGTLVIPFECADNTDKYWKKEGHKMAEILTELNAPKEIWEKYTHVPYPEDKGE